MARRILALLLLVMAGGQLSNLPGFVDAVEGYRIGGRDAAWAFAITILVTEAVSGIGLLLAPPPARRLGSSLAVVAAVAWTVMGVQAFARGLALENCGCFGVHFAQPLRWWVLLEDAEFIALAAWVHHKNELGRRSISSGLQARGPAIDSGRNTCSTTTQPVRRAGSTADSS